MSQPKLLGELVIVTGGAGGIGRAICMLFADEGASIGIVDIDKNGMEDTLQLLSSNHENSHCIVEADVSRHDHVIRAFQTVEEKSGRKCSVLINNAGIEGVPKLIGDLEEKDIDLVININLKAAILMSNEFVKRLKSSEEPSEKETRGCVINISSIAGKGGVSHGSPYAVSKAGLVGLTKSMALEFPYSRIRCNAIVPGAIGTPMLARISQTLPNADVALAAVPMQRIGTPKEVAEACLYLASDRSSYVNGAALELTGGLGC